MKDNSINKTPICKICGKSAGELTEYITAAAENNTTPEAIAKGDGTYNYFTGKFYCTQCYIKIGMPLGTA